MGRLIYVNFMLGLGALKHLQKLGLDLLDIYDFLFIYANFMLGLDAVEHLQNTIVDIYEVARVSRSLYNYLGHYSYTPYK